MTAHIITAALAAQLIGAACYWAWAATWES